MASCCLAMNTVNENPSVCQSQCCCCGCGGASGASQWLNAAGKWGTIMLATAQGKPVVTGKGGVAVGAKGSQSVGGSKISGNSLLIILVVIGVIIFLATR
jgi:hypothetical protein